MRKLLVLLLLAVSPFSKAQTDFERADYAFFAGVSVGYTLHAGLTIGTEIGAGLVRYTIKGYPVFTGFAVSGEGFRYNKNKFRMISFNCLGYSPNVMLQLGVAHTWYRWGMQDRNITASKELGPSIEIAGGPYAPYSPWVGFRSFAIRNHCLGFVTDYCKSVNLQYNYRFLLLNEY